MNFFTSYIKAAKYSGLKTYLIKHFDHSSIHYLFIYLTYASILNQ